MPDTEPRFAAEDEEKLTQEMVEPVPFSEGISAEGVDEGVPETRDVTDEEFAEFEELEMDYAEDVVQVSDPLEPFNRAMFTFNDRLYFWALKPAAQGYNTIVHEKIRRGFRNFFQNLVFPVRFVNNVLQGKFHQAGLETDRFIINSTVGLAGFADVASRHEELTLPPEDTGQTLGSYGIGTGFYIVWPVFGPSTVRDSVGMVGDFFLNPASYFPDSTSTISKSFDKFNSTSLSLGEYESLKEASLDPYSALKDAYIQNRKSLIED
ncbi:MAG: VacJ family lipoprotein [Desulfovibrionales bacterium]